MTNVNIQFYVFIDAITQVIEELMILKLEYKSVDISRKAVSFTLGALNLKILQKLLELKALQYLLMHFFVMKIAHTVR